MLKSEERYKIYTAGLWSLEGFLVSFDNTFLKLRLDNDKIALIVMSNISAIVEASLDAADDLTRFPANDSEINFETPKPSPYPDNQATMFIPATLVGEKADSNDFGISFGPTTNIDLVTLKKPGVKNDSKE